MVHPIYFSAINLTESEPQNDNLYPMLFQPYYFQGELMYHHQ